MIGLFLISAVCAVLRADLNRMVKVNKQQYPHLNDHVPALLVVGAHRARVGKQLASVRVARTSRLASPTLCEVRPHSCVRCPVPGVPAAARHNVQELCGLLPMNHRTIVLVLWNHYVLLSSVTRRVQ